jgi:hypothetical protein
MKILGNNGSGYDSERVYFLTATKGELANLMGYYYSSEAETKTHLDRPGTEIPINEMFTRLYTLANKEKELMEISAKLKAAADFVNSALPCLKTVNEKAAE